MWFTGFRRRVHREVRDLAASLSDGHSGAAPTRPALPPPVERYLSIALRDRSSPIRFARMRHGGSFRPSPEGSWRPIRGEQYFRPDPPAFIWWGRVRMAPGLWVDARDRSVDGAGRMLVRIESLITIADARGPELDQGALLRLLGEMSWFPTAWLDERYVRWSSIDGTHARAMLTVAGRSVSGDFGFDADGLPATFAAERYRDVGRGRSVLTPFAGRLTDFRAVDGMLVPHRAVAAWIIGGRAVEYARFDVQRIEFDRPEPW